jgi:uncharacterized membrane protein required for colicin V production
MVSLVVVFITFIILFAIIGGMRGWAKELLATSSIVLALFLMQILDRHIRPYSTALVMQPPATQFMIRGTMLVLLAFFGYQTPNIRALQPKMVRERLQDILLGIFMGALNGYLLVGSLWFFLHELNYPTSLVQMPAEGSELFEQIQAFIHYLPPSVLPIPQIYFAVGIVFVFIIVVFV